MTNEHDKALTYTNYLRVDELLDLQTPVSDGPEHDELLFITIHQVYELWFKQILHESAALQLTLESGNTHRSLALLGRIRTIMKTCVAQLDILETMTPLQFNSFRGRLSSASGFQSAQFRELEAVLGRRDQAGANASPGTGMAMAAHLVPGSKARNRVEDAMKRPSLYDSALKFFSLRGHNIPESVLTRDISIGYEANEAVQDALLEALSNYTLNPRILIPDLYISYYPYKLSWREVRVLKSFISLIFLDKLEVTMVAEDFQSFTAEDIRSKYNALYVYDCLEWLDRLYGDESFNKKPMPHVTVNAPALLKKFPISEQEIRNMTEGKVDPFETISSVTDMMIGTQFQPSSIYSVDLSRLKK
jgi:tryptophan 2,3-dioxygenase